MAKEPVAQHLTIGEPLPAMAGRMGASDRFALGNQAGRYMVLCAFGSAADEASRQTLAAIHENRALFDDSKISFFGISGDPADESLERVQPLIPGIRYFWDFDHAMSRQLGALAPGDGIVEPLIVVTDPQLRVYATLRFEPDLGHVAKLMALLRSLPEPAMHAGVPMQAPVLIVPRIFEPALCDRLINLYETGGGNDSGFMRDVDGRTVGIIDYRLKRRSDHEIRDREIKMMTQRRILRRLLPEIQKAFQFRVTRIERYIVACYDADIGGYFKPHRDNTTKGTAHRKFAVTINLNTGDYAGGGLNFPEYGPQVYHAPRGGAVVFSCSMLHQALPVRRGKRYVFLPFLYDESGATVRRENSQFLDRKKAGGTAGEASGENGEAGEDDAAADRPAARVVAPR